MTSYNYSVIPKATFTIVDFNTNRRTVLDSDGNLISTNIDPEDIEFGQEQQQQQKTDLEQKYLKKDEKDLKLRNLVFLSKLIYS